MLVSTGAVDPLTTLVMTTVHDCQLYDSLPTDMFGEHDLTVDVIATPTQLIRCEPRLPKPKGIIWSLLTSEQLEKIPILNTFRDMDQKNGKNVVLKDYFK
ncbi:unnamed protein product [Medioppia subpectinata]|uniref:Uncharacterized protein n=1 Tax=Medioppia subpectinata TaxID=1979941 RepID=A0A7R9PZN2_9ACAR|nr:unnamed protein product [Medioppia subpectinata]CAG2107135.1 unnamed protein product [Medioppia subpectinata]